MPKISSSSHSSSQKAERLVHISEDDEKPENSDFNCATSDGTRTLKQKAINRVKIILHQMLLPQSAAFLTEKTRVNSLKRPIDASLEEKASDNLYQLIAIALTHPNYLKTESVLRLVTNEVEKQNALQNLEQFLIKAKTNPPSVNLLTVLIKHQLKQAISQEIKKRIILSLGVTVNELNKQNISKIRFQEINQQLEDHIPTLNELPAKLIDIIDFSKKLTQNQAANKMPPSAIAFSLAPCLLPELKRGTEYHLTLLRFEIQLNTLLKQAFKAWILHYQASQ